MDNKNMKKLKVAFICVHNSCRSQMAEAISKIFVSDTSAYELASKSWRKVYSEYLTRKEAFFFSLTLIVI